MQTKRQYSLAEKKHHVEKYMASGLSMRDYEELNGLGFGNLQRWKVQFLDDKFTLDNAVAVAKDNITYYLVKGAFYTNLDEAKKNAAMLNNAPIDVFVKTKRLTPIVEWK